MKLLARLKRDIATATDAMRTLRLTRGIAKNPACILPRLGFDPAATHDPIWFDDARVQCFVPLDNTLFKNIVTGKIRL